MKPARICDQCHGELPGDAPEGLCPQCLLSFAGSELGIPVRKLEARPPTMGPATGSRQFGNYEVLDRVGQGGMGAVYRARQLTLDRVVALKLLPFGQFSSREVVQRFRSEASAAAALQHPNIVAVHDVGEHDGQPFFSMDFVEGRTLAELVRDQPLPAKRAAAYLKTIAAAVHYAHQQGILHRDLKPSNVLVDTFDQPRITDFGLAKRLAGDSDLTLTGQVLGSPNFISPEQAEGRSDAIGPASDIYSLGALLYHLLTRQPPFQADTLTTLLKQVIESEPVSPRLLNPGIPRDLETICLKCLEKEPARRYPTALALAEDLSRFLNGEPILARPVSTVVKAWKWCRARPALAGLSAALLLSLLAGFTSVLWQLGRVRSSESATRANAYAADMVLAQGAVENGDLGAAINLLDAHRPAPGQQDLRGWEWRYLWQQCRGDEQSEIIRFPAIVDRVAFSPDGRWLAVRDEHSTLTLWDAKSRQRGSSFKMWGYLNPFAFSQRGNLLGYASAGTRAVSVVNLDTSQEIARFPRATNVLRLAFSADADKVLILEEDGSLAQWDLNSKQLLSAATLPRGELSSLTKAITFSSDGAMLAYESVNGFTLWETDTGRRARLQLDSAGSSLTALSFSSDGKLLAAGVVGSDNELYVWGVEDLWRSTGATPAPRGKFGKHRDQICDLAFSPDGRALASASADSSVGVWELDRPAAGRRYQGHRHQVLSVAWSTDGHALASGGRDGSVRLWDLSRQPAASGPQVLPILSANWSFRLSSNGQMAVFVEPTNGTVVLWDVVKARATETLAFAGTNNNTVAWSTDGRMLAVGDTAGSVQVWDLADRRLLSRMQLPGLVGVMVFSADERFLGCGALDTRTWRKAVRVWQVEGWREIPIPREADERLDWAALSPDGRLLACLHYAGALDIWDLSTGRCRSRNSQPLAGPLEEGLIAFAPDGLTWASLTRNGVIALWHARGNQPPTVLPRSAQELWYIKYSPDSARLLVSGKRAADVVRLLDVRSKRFVASFPGPPDLYLGAWMSADNNTLCAVGLQRVLLWRAPSWAEIEAAEKKQPL